MAYNKAETKSTQLQSLELFTGAGGLALGVAKAGFKHVGILEWDRDACSSLRDNGKRIGLMGGWPIVEGDVREYDFRRHRGSISLLAAGVPCQPFSLGGKHRGHADDRNMFPEVFKAIHECLPAAVLIENVKGLLRSSFSSYFEYIKRALSMPELLIQDGEEWQAHAARLERASASQRVKGVRYRVTQQLVNAADYGVPQRRERVFLVALRDDIAEPWEELERSHSEEALLFSQWIECSYWEEHGLRKPKTPPHLIARVDKMRRSEKMPTTRPWKTVRDALRGLPTPQDYLPHPRFANHVGNPGARSYPGHTGSAWDVPAKTLKAGDHGVPGGENMLLDDDGSVRYFTVREAARLQTFPDKYVFSGAWSEGFRQLGNAVPVTLAFAFGERLKALLGRADAATKSHVRVA